jgi:hypothetical protein
MYTNLYVLKDVQTFSSKLFDEFIKGITYFGDNFRIDEQPKPLYHRCSSCGPSQREVKEENIETCYIERLIYNEIYKHHELHFPKTIEQVDFFEPSQDEGHLHFLLNIIRPKFFSKHHDVQDIVVVINQHVIDTIPVSLTIIKTFHNDTKITETYKKEYTLTTNGNRLYKHDVYCERICNTSNCVKKYTKVQVYYEKPKDWKECLL